MDAMERHGDWRACKGRCLSLDGLHKIWRIKHVFTARVGMGEIFRGNGYDG